MTDSPELPTRPAVNPFLVPGWEDSPRRPLCPWIDSTHEDYYVPVDQTHEAFEEFKRRMRNLAGLREDGRLVLVMGDSGCGKTALINRCAAWVRSTLEQHELRGAIIDLTMELASSPRRSADDRVSHVCGRLVDELEHLKLLSEEGLRYLAQNRDRADLVYPYLGGALDDEIVLIILLPPSEDLIEEVIRYAGLVRRKLLFFTESSYLDAGQARQVERSQRACPPIVLKVGVLDPEDVHRYITERLSRHAENGMYPRMSEETIDRVAAGPPRSVAMLQSILSGVYEDRRRRALRYSESDWVSYEDITEFVYVSSLKEAAGMRGR